MTITEFKHIKEKLVAESRISTIAVVNATDQTTRSAVARAMDAGIARAVFFGARAEVEADEALAAHPDMVAIVDCAGGDDAAARAVALVRDGGADVLMKGMLNTDNLLRAVLDKQQGILVKGDVLTHITVAEIPAYHKLLAFTDAAVIPYPTPAQRASQLRYVVSLMHELGVAAPRVSLIHCTEKVDERHFPFTADYAALKQAVAEGRYGRCIVDGPLDLKTSLSKAALDKKGLVSPVDGDADALIFPDIESANVFYKTITLFASAKTAGILCGCMAPVVLPSRGDSVDSKYSSLLMAIVAGSQR